MLFIVQNSRINKHKILFTEFLENTRGDIKNRRRIILNCNCVLVCGRGLD